MSVTHCRPLIRVLAEVPEFRHQQGRRYTLVAILGLACAAILCGYQSYDAMAEWGHLYGTDLALCLGFPNGQTPCAATFYNVFSQLDKQVLEAKLSAWAEDVLPSRASPEEDEGIASDGKTLRGSKKQGAEQAHPLSALSHRLGLTLSQQAVDDKTHAIPAIQTVLSGLILQGRVVTVDALLTQKAVAETIPAKGRNE